MRDTDLEIRTFAGWVTVTRQQLGIEPVDRGEFDYRPIYGPERPDEVDRACWVLATADLTDEQRQILTNAVDAWAEHECDW